jgi:hypothetical protein
MPAVIDVDMLYKAWALLDMALAITTRRDAVWMKRDGEVRGEKRGEEGAAGSCAKIATKSY